MSVLHQRKRLLRRARVEGESMMMVARNLKMTRTPSSWLATTRLNQPPWHLTDFSEPWVLLLSLKPLQLDECPASFPFIQLFLFKWFLSFLFPLVVFVCFTLFFSWVVLVLFEFVPFSYCPHVFFFVFLFQLFSLQFYLYLLPVVFPVFCSCVFAFLMFFSSKLLKKSKARWRRLVRLTTVAMSRTRTTMAIKTRVRFQRLGGIWPKKWFLNILNGIRLLVHWWTSDFFFKRNKITGPGPLVNNCFF